MKEPQGFPFGTPTYDATYHPADAASLSVENGRVQQARNIHLFGSKSAAAEAFSHAYQSIPSPTVVAMMGLSAQRDLIERTVQRVDDMPFPGVELGSGPSFSRAHSTNPITPAPGQIGHHSHLVEPERTTRRRFGR